MNVDQYHDAYEERVTRLMVAMLSSPASAAMSVEDISLRAHRLAIEIDRNRFRSTERPAPASREET